jgi:hypothetical protein
MYFSMIQASMQYSAPAGTLSRKEATKLNSTLTQANLPNMGYNRHTPLAVVYGPRNLGGIGMCDLFVAQGAEKTVMILKQVRALKELGRTLRCQYQWAQRVAGTEKQVLMDSKTRIPQLDGKEGIQTLREFLRLSDMGIEIPSIETPSPKRIGDRVLMTALAESGASDLVIKRANQCRLYLRVETLADAVDEEGKEILQCVMDCESSGRTIEMSDALWPKQTRPGEVQRKAWKDALKMFCKDKSNELYHKLGKWTTKPTARRWPTYYSFERDKAVVLVADTLVEYNIEQQDRRVYRTTTPTGRRPQHQLDLVPAENQHEEGVTTFTKPQRPSIAAMEQPLENDGSWGHAIAAQSEWKRQLLEGCEKAPNTSANDDTVETMPTKLQDTESLIALLKDPRARALVVSDGGCKDKVGSYGFVVANEVTGKRIWKASGRVRGNDITSYRAEAHSMMAALAFLLTFTQHHCNGKAACTLKHYCDNDSLVQEMEWSRTWSEPSDSMKPEYDLLRGITEVRKELQECAPKYRRNSWVRGHQEDTTPYHKLPLEAQLNVDADKLATAEIVNHKKKDRLLHAITNPHCYAYLVNGNTRQTHKEMEALRTNWSGSKIKEYFKTRFEYKSVTTIHSINWDALEMARRKMSLEEQIYSTKLLTGWIASDTKKALYGDLVVGCHRCGGEETNDHMMQCPRKTVAQRKTVVEFRAFLGKLGTGFAAAEEMCHGIEDWLLSGTEGSTRTANNKYTRAAAAAQGKIGWGIAMRGLLANNGARLTKGHEQQDNSRETCGHRK